MTTYIIRRLVLALFVLVMVTLIIFFAMRLLPGDPLIIYLGQSQQLASMSTIVENVFSIPGIGNLMVSSIFAQDYAVVQSCTLVFAVMIVFTNLFVDISYGWLDPRIRYG